MPPSIDHLRARLTGRETETDESIARRLGKAEKELLTANDFDTIILNDELEKALNEAEEKIGAFVNQKISK